MPEQFHLSRLQVINWGVFDGYHSIPFSEGGALIAGASGSGKSSLLDAISLGFLPFNRRNFNASGDNSAAGSSAGRRTVDKYVRGAWGQRSDGGASKVMYLRGDGTAWSAVAVTYTSNTGRTVTGLVLKWLTGESRSDSSSRFVLADGDRDIEDVCNRWAVGPFRRGRLQGRRLAVLHQGGVAVPRPAVRDHRHPRLRRRPAAARQGQVAEKRWRTGTVRPRVHARRARQPDPAARGAQADRPPGRRARAAWPSRSASARSSATSRRSSSATRSESSDLGIIDLVDQPMVRAYTDHVRLAQCPAQIDSLDATIDQLGNEYEDVTRAAQSRQGRR